MRIAFTDYIQPDLDLEERLVGEAGMTMTRAEPQCAGEADVIGFAAGADALVVQSAPMTAAVFAALPGLRIVSLPSIGVDSIDLEAAKAHGVWVANVPDANYTEVASHAVAMALSLIRQLPGFDRAIREGRWDYEACGPLTRPGNLTFGIVGLGRIGRTAAAYAAPIFGRLIGHDPHLPEAAWPAGVERLADISDLFRQADVVTLHMPLTKDTHALVDGRRLARMKPGAYLVNVSRGPIVDMEALRTALDAGRLAGAALDVLPQEPPDPDDPILSHPKVLLSPHAAFYSREADEELRRRSITNILDYARDGRPRNVVVEGRR